MICSATYNCSFSPPFTTNQTTCTGSHVCSHTTIDCGDASTCLVEVDDTVDALVVNASQVSDTFELTCNQNCKAVTVYCPDTSGSTCKCTNCNHKQTYHCTMGKSYCPSYQVTRIPHWNGKVWCKSGSNQMYFYSIPHYCPSIHDASVGCRSIYTSSTSTYPYAPNDKCVAVNNTYYSTYAKRWYYNIYASACRRTINATANQYEYYRPTCIEYESGAPPPTPVVCTINQTVIVNKTRWINKTMILNKTRWINKTRWLIFNETKTWWINKTRWLNKTLIFNETKTRWLNQTRWLIFNETKTIIFNETKTRWINKTLTRWVNKTRWINKTLTQTRWLNKTRWINKTIIFNKTLALGCNSTQWMDPPQPAAFVWSIENILYMGAGLLGFFVLLYVMWHCWLKEYVEEKLDTLICCGLQGYIQPVKDACSFWQGEGEEEEEEETWQIEMQSYQITEENGQKRVEI